MLCLAVGIYHPGELVFWWGLQNAASAAVELVHCVHVCAQSCLTLCHPMGFSPLGPSFHGIFQVRILQRVAFSSPGILPDPGIETLSLVSPTLAGGFLEAIRSQSFNLSLA